ncbi:MAG: hypothetical protein D6725_11705 [Planctomycetota bacterium]|nr:MAG: hypothetical protein D6725_11705 [Planctomycetota bacterium]
MRSPGAAGKTPVTDVQSESDPVAPGGTTFAGVTAEEASAVCAAVPDPSASETSSAANTRGASETDVSSRRPDEGDGAVSGEGEPFMGAVPGGCIDVPSDRCVSIPCPVTVQW